MEVWQLPVKQSNLTNHDWIHPRANYHAFLNNSSLCGKFHQDTSYFKTDLPEGNELALQMRCKRCLKKIADTTK
ncbi:hypothetical protein [Paenibacillus sp. L3-i20]|uniref:hypothetical protein n=1 Tax=Paenibacillus sp. L3-i20 TaxID=2905833 RepID=UPI001EDCA830|nr:hypothetical protein [Paenibacillus sp. L3-i20]